MRKDPDKGFGYIALFVVVIAALLCLSLLCGCQRTVYVPVQQHHYHTDSVRVAVERVDTLMQHDSVYVERNGDTTLIVRWRDRYKVREVHDTIAREVVKVDSISVPYPVEKPLSKWQQAKMDFGGIAFGGCAALLAFAVVWLVRRFRR